VPPDLNGHPDHPPLSGKYKVKCSDPYDGEQNDRYDEIGTAVAWGATIVFFVCAPPLRPRRSLFYLLLSAHFSSLLLRALRPLRCLIVFFAIQHHVIRMYQIESLKALAAPRADV